MNCNTDDKQSGSTPFDTIHADNTVDSLFQVLKIAGEDTFRSRALSALCWYLRNENPDTAIVLGKQAVELSTKLEYKRGMAVSNSNLGVAYRLTGQYEKSLEHARLSLQHATDMGDSAQMAIAIGNLGTVCFTQGNYPVALENYLRALRIAELQNDSFRMVVQYANIGSIFTSQNEVDSMIRYFSLALSMDEALHDSMGAAFDLAGLGDAYMIKRKYDTALHYYQLAYRIDKKQDNRYALVDRSGNIGLLWQNMCEEIGDSTIIRSYRDSAMHYFTQALNISTELNDRRGYAINLGNLGRLYYDKGNYEVAERLLTNSIRLGDSLGIPDEVRNNELSLSQLYDSTGRYKEALASFRHHIAVRDSLLNDDKSNEIMRQQMNFEFQKERAVTQAKSAEEIAHQKLIRNSSIISGVLLLLVAGVSMRAYRTKKRAGEIISKQKQEVEHQKILLEEKQKEIIDSINYAQRIQSAILPKPSEIEEAFTDAFVLFQPKDIVSGDFYWLAKTADYTFIAVADCTGHGVPGGFMSMLGHSLLNEIVIEKKTYNTGDILDLLRLKIISALKQTGNTGENKDGMDMVICRFSQNNRQLMFSCANNPLWLCRNGAIVEFKADKFPVGISSTDQHAQFTTHETQLLPGDNIFMFTDGYADQFGGPKGKKFKYKPLQELFLSIGHLSASGKKEKLSDTFTQWRGNLEQVDDVLVIGVRV